MRAFSHIGREDPVWWQERLPKRSFPSLHGMWLERSVLNSGRGRLRLPFVTVFPEKGRLPWKWLARSRIPPYLPDRLPPGIQIFLFLPADDAQDRIHRNVQDSDLYRAPHLFRRNLVTLYPALAGKVLHRNAHLRPAEIGLMFVFTAGGNQKSLFKGGV